MLDDDTHRAVLQCTGATSVLRIEHVQSVWSGYGDVLRLELRGGTTDSIVVKRVNIPKNAQHPRGWATDRSEQRKRHSYDVETHFYRSVAPHLPVACRVAEAHHLAQPAAGSWIWVLEDLSSDFPHRHSSLSPEAATPYVNWLAALHAAGLSLSTEGLWPTGCYWHLDTRPDEFTHMADGPIKRAAQWMDQQLSASRYQTLLHGDAKLANFCANERSVAAVDFQYSGRGPGVRDVTYFLGSAFNSDELDAWADSLIDTYFLALRRYVTADTDADDLEADWRALIPIAWTDFTRFLLGWAPEHGKLNPYTQKMAELALEGFR